jgi:nickel-dependent lactate racemase
MRIGIGYGQAHLDVDVPDGSVLAVRRQPPPPDVADPVAAVRAALEAPVDYPPLRRALIPDDHVALVVDDRLPRFVDLLVAVLEHVAQAQVSPEGVTLLCPPGSSQDWVDDLPDAFQEVRVEVHDPADRRRLAYVNSTAAGRRIYLNRTLVDANQVVVLARRGYDPLLGYSGAEGNLFPALSDEATLRELNARLSAAPSEETAAGLRAEARQVAWLLGAPFLVQIIEGSGDTVSSVVTGPVAAEAEGERRLDARWRVQVAERADTVVATVRGDPARQTFADLARAVATAANVVQPDGRIILLTEAAPSLDAGGKLLTRVEEPAQALELLRKEPPADPVAAIEWASAARQARVYLLSRLPAETVEQLYATPLEHAGQVQRLLSGSGSYLFLEDAHKTRAVVKPE